MSMRIVMFSINPLFPNKVMGGAPKHLQNIAIHMGQLGHSVKVLCTQPAKNSQPFHWQENVEVLPILPFKQPFPMPYAVPAYDLASAIQIVGEYLSRADRFYMHDGEFLFPYVYAHVPTVISLRDNVYPETLTGSFLFNGDRLILISNYSRAYFESTVGRFFPELTERIDVIPNGVDWDKFKPTQPNEIIGILGVDGLVDRPVVLHPHRPEESKGIRQTIAVIDLLVNQYGFADLIALAPKWLEMQLTAELREFYDDIFREIHERGLGKNFVFHGWVPQELMPQYYSLGNVTLSLGHFPESFGNAVYESLGCGTPSIAARISTHRELLPDNLLDKVDYGDIDRAAQIAARIITDKERTRPEVLAFLRENYSIETQLNAYASVILKAKLQTPMQYQHQVIDASTCYKLSPWCYVSSRGIYHDYHANYLQDKRLLSLVKTLPDGFNSSQALEAGMSAEDVNCFYRDGYVIPLITR